MKERQNKVFWGVLILLSAAALVFYGAGFGAEFFGLPMYKLLLGLVIVAWTLSKVIFGDNLRERLKVFIPLSILFMVLEKEIASRAGLADENIINNWLLFAAAILADIAVGMLCPKKHKTKKTYVKVGDVHIDSDGVHISDDIHVGKDGVKFSDSDDTDDSTHKNASFSDVTYYADASKARYHYYSNRMGNMHIYYQNTDLVSDGEESELELECKMSNTVVHIPYDWEVSNDIRTNMGNTQIRENKGNRVKLKLKGSNKMANIEIVSP